MQTVKKQAIQGITQFELSKTVLHNLKHFELTPIGKLVLLVLVDCYNPQNDVLVFPSMEYIADLAGVGLTAVKTSINDLISKGLIIKSKRSKIRGNYNKYLLTQKVRNLTSERSENEFLKQTENDRSMITKNKEQINNKLNKPDLLILEDYAQKHGAKNKAAYIKALQKSGSAGIILNEIKQAEINSKAMANYTKAQIEQAKNDRLTCEPPSEKWYELKKILMR